MIKDDEFLEKYNKIWNKVSNSIKKGFDSEPVYHEKYLKTKVKSYQGELNVNFLSAIFMDFVFKIGKNFYPQVFLGECKYIVKEKKVITDDLEISSDDSNKEISDKED